MGAMVTSLGSRFVAEIKLGKTVLHLPNPHNWRNSSPKLDCEELSR